MSDVDDAAKADATAGADAAVTTAEPEPPPKTTVTVTIDGVAHEAPPGQLVIEACNDAGTYVPRFCYHRRLTPVGMCRQCLVEIQGPRGPMLVVSCMTPVAEGQVVHTATDSVKRAQEGVLELFLANHPLDCPVCDKGGECPLQDQTLSHGPGESRYVEQKRHFEKPIPISDLVLLDRERCILCDRCTRFADEVAGDKLIHFVNRSNDTQVLTFPDEPFASYFSGNTVQICPVGALTATPYRFKARPWDLEQVESTCTTCSVGCRVVIQSSRDRGAALPGRRLRPGQLGMAVRPRAGSTSRRSTPTERLAAPLVRGESGLVETSWSGALGDRVGARPRGARRRWAGRDRTARRCSRHERGRVRAGPSSPTRSASIRRDAQMGDGLAAGGARTRSGDHRRSCQRVDDRAASAPTSKRSCRCCTCGCATPPRSAAAGSSRSRRSSRASRTWRGRASGTSRVERPASSAPRCPSPTSTEQLGEGQRGRRRRARQPRRVAGVGGRLVGGAARRRARCQGAARPPAGQRRRRPRARAPTARRPTTVPTTGPMMVWAFCGRPPRASSTCWCCSERIRSTTAPTSISPAGRWPALAGCCRSTRS